MTLRARLLFAVVLCTLMGVASSVYPERRAQLRDRLFVALSEALPTLPLVFAAERMVARPELAGWRQDDLTRSFGGDLQGWRFEEPVP